MKHFDRIRKQYSENKGFFILQAILRIITIIFSIWVIFYSISALINDMPAKKMFLLLACMFFFGGVSNVTELIKMSLNDKKDNFKPLLLNTIFVFFMSTIMLSTHILLLQKWFQHCQKKHPQGCFFWFNKSA